MANTLQSKVSSWIEEAEQNIANFFRPTIPSKTPQATQAFQTMLANTPTPIVKKPITIDTTGGLYNRIKAAVFTPLAGIQKNIEDPNYQAPKFHFADNKTGVVGLGLNMGQDLLNTPSNYVEGIVNTGVGLHQGNGQRVLKGAGQVGGSILNVATLGTGGSIAKEAGTVGLKQLATEGAIQGTKYGAGYGLTGGLVSHSDASSVEEQLKQTFPDILIGAGTGGILGGILAGGAGLLGKLRKGASKVDKQLEKEVTEIASSSKTQEEKMAMLRGVLTSTDVQTKDRVAKGLTAEEAFLGKKTTIDPRGEFENWVNNRRATQLEGTVISQKFEPLREQGMDAITRFQRGDRTGLLADVQTYFDNKFQQIKNAGVPINFKNQYLPQLWLNTQEEIEQVMGRKLTQKPGFSLQSVIKDYEEGIAKGLTPRFDSIPDLIKNYETIANKVIADKQFFNTLTKSGYVVPATKAPASWVTLNPDRFPKVALKTAEGTYNGFYKAPKELGQVINNYLNDPNMPFFKATGEFSTAIKNLGLNSGIPNIKVLEDSVGGYNFHTTNILGRHILFSKNLSELYTGVKYVFNRKAARTYIDEVLPELPRMVKAGLTVSTEDKAAFYDVAQQTGLLKKAGEKLDTWFSKPLFEEIVPALKAQHFKSIEADLISSGINPQEAAKTAAKQVNSIFGGINWEQLGRSKDTQNLLRTVLLAPDWLESTGQIAVGTGKALLNPNSPEGKIYRIGVRNLLIAYSSLNVLNYMTSGHLAIQNDPGHAFDLEAGYTSNGQKRYVRPFGTSVDYVRLPFDIAASAMSGDSGKVFSTVRNRLSPVASQALGQLTNTNYAGQPIANKEDPFGKQLLSRAVDASTTFTPSFIGAPAQFATGQLGAEQALSRSLELPMSYYGGPYSKTQKLATEGLSGKEKYDISNELKGESLSEDQQAKIKSLVNSGYSPKEALDVIMMPRRLERAKKALLNGESTSIPSMPDSAIEDPLLRAVNEKKKSDDEDRLISWAFENGKSEEQVDLLLKSVGVNKTYQDAKYQMIKSLDTPQQAAFVWQELKTVGSGDNYIGKVKELADKGLLTSAVISDWYENGLITEDGKTAINNAIKLTKKTLKAKKPKKISMPSAPKIKTPRSQLTFGSTPNFTPLKKITYSSIKKK